MTNQKLIHDIEPSSGSSKLLILSLLIAVVLGTVTGYILSAPKSGDTAKETGLVSDAVVEKSVGIADKETFPDKVEGMLKEGGIEGEGNYHLDRPGGVSQSVYLTSTTVDLAPYTGKKVRVWGKTFQGEKAGWLMDVGYVEILK